jgi:deoxyribose-phosphate aldolase
MELFKLKSIQEAFFVALLKKIMIDKAIQLVQKIDDKPSEQLSSEQLKQLITLIDFTTLNDDDTEESVSKWMDGSVELMNSVGVYCGGWCTYSEFSPLLREKRKNLPIAIASVCGNFPSGKAHTQLKIEEAVLCESLGAEEIDVVINKGWAKENAFAKIEKEISLIKGSLDKAHLKVIMETGMLSHEQIAEISKCALRAGADFIKTSTGKTPKGASLEAVAIMCYAIEEHYRLSGRMAGIKPSGGISIPEDAFRYYQVVDTILGKDWLTNERFRIGASRLLSNSVEELKQIES